MKNLKILQYELEHHTDTGMTITLDNTGKQWAIRRGEAVLNKIPDNDTGSFYFCYEQRPSLRDDEFYEEFRWNSAEETFDFWQKNKAKIFGTKSYKK